MTASRGRRHLGGRCFGLGLSLGISLGLSALALGCEPRAPTFTEPQRLGGHEISAEVLNQGAEVYRMHCAACHGVDGSGQGAASRNAARPPRDFRTGEFRHIGQGDALPSDAELVELIQRGVPSAGMPGFRGLRADDLDALAHYLKTFSPRWAEVPPAGDLPPDPAPTAGSGP